MLQNTLGDGTYSAPSWRADVGLTKILADFSSPIFNDIVDQERPKRNPESERLTFHRKKNFIFPFRLNPNFWGDEAIRTDSPPKWIGPGESVADLLVW